MMSIIFYILLLLNILCTCRAQDPLRELCNNNSNISSNSQASKNIDLVLAKLVSETSSKGFSTTSVGYNKDKVFGLAQCRGDVSGSDCTNCIQEAAKKIRESCPNQSDSSIRYDFCFLRYSQDNFIGKLDTNGGLIYYNIANVSETDTETFNKELGTLFDKIRSEAVKTGNQGLGKDETKLTPFTTLYALVQCNRDLSKLDCAQCLAISAGSFQNVCNNKKGCRVLYRSCYVRYELYPFFFPLDSVSTHVIGTTSSTLIYP